MNERSISSVDALVLLWVVCAIFSDSALAVFSASVIHEGAHIIALRVTGGKYRINTASAGLRIRYASGSLGVGRELAVILSGVAANIVFGLAAVAFGYFRIAAVNLIIAAFNILPISSLDGGEALYCCASSRLDPFSCEKMCHTVSLFSASVFWAISLYFQFRIAPSPEILCVAVYLLMNELI